MTNQEQIAALKQKLAARKKTPGWAANAKAIEQRIAELETSE